MNVPSGGTLLSKDELVFISLLLPAVWAASKKFCVVPLIFQNRCQQYRTNRGRRSKALVPMSRDRTSPGEESGQALMCWFEAPDSPSREEFVQVLESHLSEALIKSALQVNEKTKVTLIGRDYTGIGIVKSCRKDGESFILQVAMVGESMKTATPSKPDPGALVVDDFITEEQETKILEGLEDSTYRSRLASVRLWPSCALAEKVFSGPRKFSYKFFVCTL
jgi:hypothetical protein